MLISLIYAIQILQQHVPNIRSHRDYFKMFQALLLIIFVHSVCNGWELRKIQLVIKVQSLCIDQHHLPRNKKKISETACTAGKFSVAVSTSNLQPLRQAPTGSDPRKFPHLGLFVCRIAWLQGAIGYGTLPQWAQTLRSELLAQASRHSPLSKSESPVWSW